MGPTAVATELHEGSRAVGHGAFQGIQGIQTLQFSGCRGLPRNRRPSEDPKAPQSPAAPRRPPRLRLGGRGASGRFYSARRRPWVAM